MVWLDTPVVVGTAQYFTDAHKNSAVIACVPASHLEATVEDFSKLIYKTDKFRLLEFICFLQSLNTPFFMTINTMYISILLLWDFISIWVSIIYCSRLDTDCRAVCQNTAPIESFNADFNITSLFHSVFIQITLSLRGAAFPALFLLLAQSLRVNGRMQRLLKVWVYSEVMQDVLWWDHQETDVWLVLRNGWFLDFFLPFFIRLR